jgi:hypothetical protein
MGGPPLVVLDVEKAETREKVFCTLHEEFYSVIRFASCCFIVDVINRSMQCGLYHSDPLGST